MKKTKCCLHVQLNNKDLDRLAGGTPVQVMVTIQPSEVTADALAQIRGGQVAASTAEISFKVAP